MAEQHSLLDKLDMSILANLSTDSSIPVPTLASKINSNQSIVYSRIRRLKNRGVIKQYTIKIDTGLLGYAVKALVGIKMSSKKRDTIVAALLGTDGVISASEVTGRFDILATVYASTLEDMHEIISKNIGKIDGVISSETFLEMKSVEKDMPHTPRRK